jgi:hypothetical protein
MELGTASVLAQLLLICILVAVFAGRRYLRANHERRNQHPGHAALPASPAPTAQSARPPAPQLVDLPLMALRAPATLNTQSLVPEELLPPCFTDTCADWAQVNVVLSLSDWSAPTDHVVLDSPPAPADLGWAIDAPVQAPRAVRPVPLRAMASAMSCTIAPQVRHCA